MKLDLEDDNVHLVEVTRKGVRDLIDIIEDSDISGTLDEAQGAFPERGTQYVVIEINAA